MIKKQFLMAGLLSFLIGIFLLLNAFQTVTGFVVVNEINKGASSILGFLLALGGLLLIFFSGSESNLDKKNEEPPYNIVQKENTSALRIITTQQNNASDRI